MYVLCVGMWGREGWPSGFLGIAHKLENKRVTISIRTRYGHERQPWGLMQASGLGAMVEASSETNTLLRKDEWKHFVRMCWAWMRSSRSISNLLRRKSYYWSESWCKPRLLLHIYFLLRYEFLNLNPVVGHVMPTIWSNFYRIFPYYMHTYWCTSNDHHCVCI